MHAGNILATQRLIRWHPGAHVGMGRNKTLYALEDGIVRYTKEVYVPPPRSSESREVICSLPKGAILYKTFISVIAAGAISGSSRRGQNRGPARVRGPLVTIVLFIAACRPVAGRAAPSVCLLTAQRGLPSPWAHPPPSTQPAPEPGAIAAAAGPRTPERGQQLPAAQVS